MGEIKNINSLNRQARKYLLEHCVSKRGAEVIVNNFSGYINSDYVSDIELIRRKSKWFTFSYGGFDEKLILSLSGNHDGFSMTRNTIS